MTLTKSNGPLAANAPSTTNYEIVGPQHKILFSPFPRRVRATFAGKTVLDTGEGMLLHETNLLPALYVPIADVATELLAPTHTTTHCPFKGDATYWDIVVGDTRSHDAVWGYPEPIGETAWLAGYVAFYWDRVDHWYDEDEEVFGHLRDPYHRVDVRRRHARVRVSIDGTQVADTTAPLVLSETGFPNRYYIPHGDVDLAALTGSDTSNHCPYKGQAEYFSTPKVTDVAWSYPTPFAEVAPIAGHLSFLGDGVEIELA